ncbi:PR domain zinc finger protein 2 isoform X2 [Brachyhypopomus gauderio]
MCDIKEGVSIEEERPSASSEPAQEKRVSNSSNIESEDSSLAPTAEKEQNGSEEADQLQLLRPHDSPAPPADVKLENNNEQPDPHLASDSPVKESSESTLCEGESSLVFPELDAECDLDDDVQGETHPCQHCERHFSTKQGLERHAHIHSMANHQTHTFKCRYCSKPFGSQVGRRRHERRHESGSKGLKRSGSLAGTAFLLGPTGLNNSPTSDCVSSPCPTVISSQNGPPQPGSDASKDTGAESDPPFVSDENGESKELHPCKYCNKTFGTHTNMRRHQRRIHERHLMPKGVRRKGILLQDGSTQQLDQGHAVALGPRSPNSSPPPTYVPSVDTEDEGEREEGMVDISKNISENLSLYIDGKILSTSSDSGCEVIEVDSNAAALFGLDAVILNSNQINQVLKVETRPGPMKELSISAQSTSKRRTSTPPLLPDVKMESETVSSAASSASSQSPLLVSNVFPQSAETLAFQKEKTIYLSPKLKQLLQAQDSQKSSLAVIADSRRLTTPLSITSLPAAQGRFKRRTGSPPTPTQSSSSENSNPETGDSQPLKVPKVESHSTNQSWTISSKDQRDSRSPPGKEWPASISGGNSCNEQPLDLSSAVAKKDGDVSKGPGESVLDLSVHRKNAGDPETKASMSVQTHVKRKKPNTSMLEKVLMNEYAGLGSSAEEGCPSLGSPDTHLSPGSVTSVSPSSPCSNSELPCESASPPSLTPVIMNPFSPSTSSQASSTPPPPVLPSVPSPPPLAPSSDCSFPKLSPKPVDHVMDTAPGSPVITETCNDALSLNDDDLDQTAEQVHPTTDALPSSPQDVKIHCKAGSISESENETLLKGSTFDSKFNLLKNANNAVSSFERNIDSSTSHSTSFDGSLPQNLNVKTEVEQKPQSSQSPEHRHPDAETHTPFNLVLDSQTSYIGLLAGKGTGVDEPVKVKSTAEVLPSANGMSSSALLGAPTETPDVTDTSEQDTFTKSFVCNVCKEPFNSIKELSSHIVDHAAERPFKCEFCVQLFGNAVALLEHRSSLHDVGRIHVCSVCSKEFAFLCNLQQHQSDLHPGQNCTHTIVENGKLRPQNYTDPTQADMEKISTHPAPDTTVDQDSLDYCGVGDTSDVKTEAVDDVTGQEDSTEELYTTIKIMAAEAGKPKGPDVRLGINQHYPSFKPPPFPYHNRTPAGEVASATNFTTHNIPQTFSTAIRCTKCGNSFDNMPELHKHILACANASDKRRYTPKKNPIPLRQIGKQPLNGVMRRTLAPATTTGQNVFRRIGQPKRLSFNPEMPSKIKMTALNRKKNQLVQKAISQKNKAATSVRKTPTQVKNEVPDVHICPHCSREFTYPASLTKHIACSCPQKPVDKKNKGAPTPQDKNMNLRSRNTDSEIKQEAGMGPSARPLGKTRARSSEPLESNVAVSRGKTGVSQVRSKRPATGPDSTAHKSKKGRKSSRQTPAPSTPALTDEPLAQPSPKAPRAGKEAAPKKEVDVKSQGQSKKEERFSLRVRERVGGPVTRSLQMAGSLGSGGTEEPANSDAGLGEYTESLLKQTR